MGRSVSTKATQTVIRQRIEKVLELRLNGAEFADIVQYASAPPAPETPWGVRERQMWNYIRRADELCVERFNANAPHLLNRHLLQRRRLFGHAMDVGDYRTALAVLQDEAKLEGLYPPTTHEHVGSKGGPIQHEHKAIVEMSDAELRAIANRGRSRVGETPPGQAGTPATGASPPEP
jgi:hypothetical protein